MERHCIFTLPRLQKEIVGSAASTGVDQGKIRPRAEDAVENTRIPEADVESLGGHWGRRDRGRGEREA